MPDDVMLRVHVGRRREPRRTREKIPFINICYSCRLWSFVASGTVIQQSRSYEKPCTFANATCETRILVSYYPYELCSCFVCCSFLFLVCLSLIIASNFTSNITTKHIISSCGITVYFIDRNNFARFFPIAGCVWRINKELGEEIIVIEFFYTSSIKAWKFIVESCR